MTLDGIREILQADADAVFKSSAYGELEEIQLSYLTITYTDDNVEQIIALDREDRPHGIGVITRSPTAYDLLKADLNSISTLEDANQTMLDNAKAKLEKHKNKLNVIDN